MRNVCSKWFWLPALMAGLVTFSARATDVQSELQDLKQANATLQAQLQEQRKTIELLSRQVLQVQQAQAATGVREGNNAPSTLPGGIDLGRIHLSGEAGIGFFHSGSEGIAPNSEFRVDEAKLFAEAQVWDNVFVFSELNLADTEQGDGSLGLHLGEFYVDFEDVSQLWGQDKVLNFKAGRMDIPFGEEYMYRDAIDNVLISHSLADFWGVDAGLEAYGAIGKFSYVAAVQNGAGGIHDFTKDKSVAARASYDPTAWLHLSVSGMRTGDIDPNNEFTTALWYGGGWISSIGAPATTTRFHANLVQGDVRVKWHRGYVAASGGYIDYDDNDSAGNNHRGLYHYSIEARQGLTSKLYAAVRFSQILADKGYPLSGLGNMNEYSAPTTLTDNLWRLSLGLGYQFNDHLVVKGEYTFERGHEVTGENRNREDFFALEAALKF